MTPDELADRLENAADQLGDAITRRVKHTAGIGLMMIKANASGRPGPNVRSAANNYRDSWESVPRSLAVGCKATLGTKKPQGRRLEFGFWDMTDSIGRHFYQPPYPHVGPAIPGIEMILREQMRDAVEEVLS